MQNKASEKDMKAKTEEQRPLQENPPESSTTTQTLSPTEAPPDHEKIVSSEFDRLLASVLGISGVFPGDLHLQEEDNVRLYQKIDDDDAPCWEGLLERDADSRPTPDVAMERISRLKTLMPEVKSEILHG
jgi:hypothetical protein